MVQWKDIVLKYSGRNNIYLTMDPVSVNIVCWSQRSAYRLSMMNS